MLHSASFCFILLHLHLSHGFDMLRFWGEKLKFLLGLEVSARNQENTLVCPLRICPMGEYGTIVWLILLFQDMSEISDLVIHTHVVENHAHLVVGLCISESANEKWDEMDLPATSAHKMLLCLYLSWMVEFCRISGLGFFECR